jgi:hypothetical protein
VSESEPKSAYELAMERLRKKDAEAGVEHRSLSDEQRAAIAEIRKTYEARIAEREILFRSERSKTTDPAALEEAEQNYRRDRDRMTRERDAKVEKIRGES